MLAIRRALMGAPRLLMPDEPSMGLASLLVEQNASAALEVSDHAYVLETGRIVLQGPAPTVAANPAVTAAYLGGT